MFNWINKVAEKRQLNRWMPYFLLRVYDARELLKDGETRNFVQSAICTTQDVEMIKLMARLKGMDATNEWIRNIFTR